MTSPGVTPSEAERETAIDVYLAWLNDPYDGPLTALIAQALADQRAKYEALADEFDADANFKGRLSDRIRQVGG